MTNNPQFASDASPALFTIEGAVLNPDITISGTGEFGNVNIGASSVLSLTIGNISDLAAPFTIESDNCSFKSLSPAGSCAISVRFSPTTTGPQSDALNIASNDPDQPNFSLSVNGTGNEAPVDDGVIVEIGFEEGTANGWLLSGNVGVDGILAIRDYSIRHTKAATSLLHVSTAGYSDVSVTMHLAATSLDNGEACYAEISTDGGDSWITVFEVLKGNDDGTFYSGTVSPSSANDNPDLQIQFRSNGSKKPDYCYGDDVIVSGTLNAAN